ncbi:TonB-dependent receptor [Fulvivirgaceae bacterium BMA10]|uniref:TonB-dependent receptor n=1 Tax=Splendidivirga corallicola TaxID=3051826 RepID=A0ABT8KYY7_9BACT|nr:TonB-dependent receptor [Fulvivirgaceae bacterium BMA10]
MKRIILCFVLFTLWFDMQAQSNNTDIKGLISDIENNPIPGISVRIEGTSLGAASDVSGTFIIKNVPSGNYVLHITGIGYESLNESVIAKAGEVIQLNITLKAATTQLQAVEITGRKEITYRNDLSFIASKTASPLNEVPQAVSYVTKEIIADQQAYRTSDIVKNISGVNQFSFYDDFTLRGFRNNSSQSKMINGLRPVGIFGPQTLLSNIERFEVIKGPASALFANANPGGTINYVTKKPLSENRKAISFTTGSFNTFRANADFTGPMNESKSLLFRLNLGYEDADSFRDLQKNKSYMVAPSISFLPTEKTSINFDLVINQYQGKLDRGQPIFGASAGTGLNSTPTSFAIGQSNDYHTNNVKYFTISLNHAFSDKLSFNTSYMKFAWDEDLFEHRTSNNFAVDSLGNQIPTLMEMQVINRVRKRVSDNITSYFAATANTGAVTHNLVAGFDYIQQLQPIGGGQSRARRYRTVDGGAGNYRASNASQFLFQNSLPVPNVPHFDLQNPRYTVAYPHEYIFNEKQSFSATKYYTYGFYIQDQIEFKNLKILLALRQENYRDVVNFETSDEETVKQDKLLPRFGMVYKLTDYLNVYGTYTESFQPQSASVLQNPNVGGPFDPLSANMIEFGAKSELFKGLLSTNLAFYQIEQNNILVNGNSPGNPDLLEQRGQERARGIELDVIGNIASNFSITANYAYNKAEITKSDDENEIGRIKENAPEHQGGFWAKYTIDKGVLDGVGIAFGTNFVTERNTFDTFREVNGSPLGLTLPSYMVFDAALYYKVNKFNISANFNNLFDKTHWVGGYSYTRLFPGAPRSFLLNVAYTF